MRIFRVRSYKEFVRHCERTSEFLQEHEAFLKAHLPVEREPFFIDGYSYTARKRVQFIVDYQHASPTGGVIWRERVCCPETYFNNRMRATFHLFDIEMEPYPDIKLYITEQVTPIYKYFSEKFQHTVGSEFLGDKVPQGQCDEQGIRNENLCSLTFADGQFDTVVSLDVFEHIPEYEIAFRECARVLHNNGRMLWSVPFIAQSPDNLVRATIENGLITHIHPPEYHGDPLSKQGVLCFQHFGWEMLEQMKKAGFSDAYAICYHSTEYGYLGGEQFLFVAIK